MSNIITTDSKETVETFEIFQNSDFGSVEAFILNDEIFFKAKEVAEILEISNIRDLMYNKSLVNGVDYKKLTNDDISVVVQGDNRTLNNRGELFLTESGLFALAFRSRLESAVKFRVWITSEVIPSIRKIGLYATPMTTQQMIDDPDLAIQLLTRMKHEREEKKLAQKQRDEAIATKAWISDKKTATAMNTASQKSKEVKKLQIELDENSNWASIIKVIKLTGVKYKWFDLKKYSIKNNYEIKKIPDSNFVKVNTYHRDVWLAVYDVEI